MTRDWSSDVCSSDLEKYKQFLSGGSSMDCIDLLKICGVDMTSKEPVENALRVFERYLEELEKR